MTTVEAFAPAKINLTLHVTGQRSDGFHLLDSLVVFGNIGDRLWLETAGEMTLKVTGRFADGVPTDSRNLVWQAAETAGFCGHIHLEKNLPHGAGLGSGSADAAAILRKFNAPDHAVRLGADVPVCLSAGPQRMQGIGEVLSPVWPVPILDLVLVNPGIGLATPDVFSSLETKKNAKMGSSPEWQSKPEFLIWLGLQRNDLEPVARRLAPAIGDVLGALGDARLARMSGSGTTCFGLYDTRNDARVAARRIADTHPDWWVQRVQTVGKDMARPEAKVN
jgi:4-diphosphocytidyl-2-C-methyl-D-erythritol kinase